MAPPDSSHERHGLVRSIVVTSVLGALGVVWGVVSGSQMILLDGVYAIIGIAISWLLLRASAVADSEPGGQFHYGRESVTPLVIGIQGVVLLGTLLYAGFEAVYTIRAGGSEVTAGWAIVYSVITTVASLFTWRWLESRAGTSDLLVAETTAWRVAALRSVGMVIGFSILGLLQGSNWSGAAPYVDPAMVLVTCALFVKDPVLMVRGTLLELLEAAPSTDIMGAVHAAVDQVSATYDLDPPEVRANKVGAKLYVEIEGVASPTATVAQEHEVRVALKEALDELPFEVWLNLELLPRGLS